jgi:hypothetical protein
MTASFTHLILRACALLLIGVQATAEENFFQTIETGESASSTRARQPWDAKAYLQQTVKYGWQSPPTAEGFERNHPGFSQVKTTLFGEGQGDLSDDMSWQLSARAESEWYFWEGDDARWKSHNSTLHLRDAFVDFAREGFWLRGGQQILAWGQSEGLVITDVLSPQDLREPGQAELQDIREPVPALLGSLALDAATKLSLVATYSAGSNRYADAQEPFDFFARYRGADLTLVEQDPTSEWEYALKLDRTFNGGDLTLMAARVNDNSLTLAGLDIPAGVLVLAQQRQTVIGGTLGWVRGNWLLKTEVAHWQDVPLATADYSPWPLHDQSRAMSGLEYSGWNDLLLGLEIHMVHTESHIARLAVDAKDVGFTAHLRHSAFNERVIQQVRILKLANEEAYMGRWELSVDWSDEWTFTCGLIAYRVPKEVSLFYPLRNHDSFNLTAKYSF